MRAPLLLALAALLGALLFAAGCFDVRQVCGQEEPGLVTEIPWPDLERAEYRLLGRESGEECGTGALTISREGGQFELSLSFEDNGNTDQSTVLVDAETLKPSSVRRERVIDGEPELIEGEYDAVEGVLNITEVSDGDDRTVPLRLEENYYDNESSLFLWRTIAFAEDYQARYDAVLASQNTQHVVTLRVRGKEAVTVPAGTFQCWRLEIEASGRRQTAWYADTPERPLVKYDNSVQVFELTAYEP